MEQLFPSEQLIQQAVTQLQVQKMGGVTYEQLSRYLFKELNLGKSSSIQQQMLLTASQSLFKTFSKGNMLVNHKLFDKLFTQTIVLSSLIDQVTLDTEPVKWKDFAQFGYKMSQTGLQFDVIAEYDKIFAKSQIKYQLEHSDEKSQVQSQFKGLSFADIAVFIAERLETHFHVDRFQFFKQELVNKQQVRKTGANAVDFFQNPLQELKFLYNAPAIEFKLLIDELAVTIKGEFCDLIKLQNLIKVAVNSTVSMQIFQMITSSIVKQLQIKREFSRRQGREVLFLYFVYVSCFFEILTKGLSFELVRGLVDVIVWHQKEKPKNLNTDQIVKMFDLDAPLIKNAAALIRVLEQLKVDYNNHDTIFVPAAPLPLVSTGLFSMSQRASSTISRSGSVGSSAKTGINPNVFDAFKEGGEIRPCRPIRSASSRRSFAQRCLLRSQGAGI